MKNVITFADCFRLTDGRRMAYETDGLWVESYKDKDRSTRGTPFYLLTGGGVIVCGVYPAGYVLFQSAFLQLYQAESLELINRRLPGRYVMSAAGVLYAVLPGGEWPLLFAGNTINPMVRLDTSGVPLPDRPEDLVRLAALLGEGVPP